MTNWKIVHGDVEPMPIDKETSPTTVYENRNAHEITVEDRNGTQTMWEYEQRQFTKDEYELLNSPTMQTIMQQLSSIELQIAEIGG